MTEQTPEQSLKLIVDRLVLKTKHDKETVYEEDNKEDDNSKPGSPRIENTYTVNFSSVTINLGVGIQF